MADGEGSKKPASRAKSLIISIVMLIISSALCVLYFLSVEPQQPPKERLPRILPLGVEDLSLDMHPHSRFLMRQELASLLEYTEPRDGYGDDISFIYDRTTPLAPLDNDFYVYLGDSGDDVWARLRAGMSAAPSFEPRYLVITVDGTTYNFDIEGLVVKLPTDLFGSSRSYIDIPLDEHGDAMRHIGNARHVTVSFENEDGSRSYQLTRAQIKATARMMRILRVRDILNRDAAEQRAIAEAEARKAESGGKKKR